MNADTGNMFRELVSRTIQREQTLWKRSPGLRCQTEAMEEK